MSNQNDENPNSYNYNPNRPQNQNEIDHSSTKKVADTAAKGAAEYLAPGVGGKVYDAAKNVPGIGDTIDNATSNIAKTADKIPGVSKTTEALDNSGVVDAVSTGIDMIGGKPQGMNKMAKSTPSGIAPSETNTVFRPYRKNMDFSHRINEQEVLEEDSMNQSSDLSDTEDLQSDKIETSDLQKDSISDEDSKNNESQSQGSFDGLGNLGKSFIKKHPVLIIGIGIGAILILLLLLVLMGGSNESNQQGYYDTACNFNDTKVNFVSCDASNSELYGTFSIEEFVEKISYAYIKDGNYSDEAIKALMVVLKTNAFSYGGYNSSSKNIDVRSCDILTNYEEDNIDSILNSTESELEHLKELYSSISEYLFLSSSYQSSISSLNSFNSLTFSNEKLEEFEVLANDELDYSEILSSVYGGSEENTSDVVYRDTLYIGDSRMQGILNSGYINNTNTVYGVGYGYHWFVGNGTIDSSKTNATSGGISGIQSKMKDGASYNIVIWLGINDLVTGANTYYQKYYELASGDWKNHQIYIVSVGPVDDTKTIYAKNNAIDDFNQNMKSLIQDSGLSNLNYIDLNYSPEYYDAEGVHYNNNDYKNIYQIISQNVVSELSNHLTLYRLSDYCVYYNLTQNDAYWWPIGSATATSGNIYGGEPTAKVVTSKFGPRNIDVVGASKNHKGVDIAMNGSACGQVIIASKSGTVVSASNNVSGYGTYVAIDHGDGIETRYAHMQYGSYTVNVGDKVEQGQKIGLIGNTGISGGCHLHFEIRINGTAVNPLKYISADNPRPTNFAVTNIDGDIKVVGDTGNYSDYAKNKSVVCNSLLASGFSQNATIGILANMETESAHTYNPQVVEYGSGYNFDTIYNAPASVAAGFGIIQWSYGRRINLINYAKENEWNPASMVAQLNFLYHEISTISSYSITQKYITGNYSSYDIAVAFCKNFERPGKSVQDLNELDSCTLRADGNVPSIEAYVKNGCSN